MIRYTIPGNWIQYDPAVILMALVEAKAAVLSLRKMPYQRAWVESLQQMELKREVAGTSRIEGAEFTEAELEKAMQETPEQLVTRSQRQAHAAVQTYRWIAAVPDDRPMDVQLVCEIHRRIVTGADDDHCPPGEVRGQDQNVNFGTPRHRGEEGGEECRRAVALLAEAIQRQYRDHDPLIQALAAHYHLAAIHPFLDGNGRTARALEALMLQRAGLRDTCFIAMSNFYYDEKTAYLAALGDARARNHDLTPFLLLGLKGIEIQSRRLLTEIQGHISKELFRNLMYDLFNRLRTKRKRVIAQRQIEIMKVLLESEWIDFPGLLRRIRPLYTSLKIPDKAILRDLNYLIQLKAVKFEEWENTYRIAIRLEWPTEITETRFFDYWKNLPRAKTHSFLS